MLTRLFLAVWRMSVSGAAVSLVMFPAVLALRRLRVPRAVCCALWLAVLVRLLCPVSFSSAVSIFNAPALGRCVEVLQGDAQVPDPAALPGDTAVLGRDEAALPAAQGAAQSGAGMPGQAGTGTPQQNTCLPDAAPGSPDRDPDAAGSAPHDETLFATDAAGMARPALPDTVLTIGPADDETAPDAAREPLFAGPEVALTLLACVWLAGALGMALYGLCGAARLRRRVALAFRVEGEPGVYTSERVTEPFAFGILRPRIYLPLGLSAGERQLILLHERAHLRRRDNLVKPLFFAALCLHWFNPLAWLAFRGMAADMEAACDEAVLRAGGGAVKADYCESLLRFSGPRPRAAVALNFGEGQVSGRVRAILTYKRPAFWAAAAAALAAALLAAACMADPAADCAAGGDGSPDGTPADEPPAQSTPAESGSETADSLSAKESTWYSTDGFWFWPVPDYTIWTDGEREYQPDTICAEAGQPILAMAAGRVQKIVTDTDGELSTIILEHPDGSHTEYGHCMGVLPAEGDEVAQGEQIAAAGPRSSAWSDGTRASAYCLVALYPAGQDWPADLWSLFESLPGRENAVGPYAGPDGADIPADPGLIWPVPDYYDVTRWMGDGHNGADIRAEAGASIVAAAGGEVITAFEHFSYGHYLVIDHGNGWRSLYAHCDSLLVSAGDIVEQGQQIATVGSTGNATGNLCHFELYIGGRRVSAREFFPTVRTAGEASEAEPYDAAMTQAEWPAYEGEAPADPGLIWPVPDYKYVSRWMSVDDKYGHKGADLCANGGAPILAALDGEVVLADYGTAENGYPGYGLVIVLLHEDGWMSLYAHCESLLADVGDTVEQGQQIATVGSSGYSTGNHCHFELIYGGRLVSAREYFAGK